nr:hypothetical protein [Tanacetum cinerariifolium]
MDQQYLTVAKIPVLDTGKFEQWQFRIQQYLQHEHYALWEAAILKTFGGNEATKKTKKNLLKQQYGNFKAEGSETLEQTFNRLQVMVVWRNKSDLDTMSLDDLYNHLKVYESEVQKKMEPNSQNMAFISSAKHSSRNEDGNTACVSTTSTNVPTTSASVATISQDTACAYIASQSSGSQIKFEDINHIDDDNMEEMDIKWNMALLSMRADKFWKKTGKKISIQGSDVAGFDKSKDRGRRDNYRQVSKAEEQAPKALMAIDGVGWDWSYMANDKEDHALVADEVAPTEFTLMANTSAKSKKLETLKEEKEGVDGKLAGLLKASKDLDNLIESQRPSPTVESTSEDDQNRNSSVSETVPSPITPKPFIKFVKPKDSQSKSKSGKIESPKKPPVKYAKQYRKPNKKPNVKGNQMSWNNLKTHQLGPDFVVKKKACFNYGDFNHLAYDCRIRVRKSFTPKPIAHRPYRPSQRPVKTNMNGARPNKTSFNKQAHSYANRPFHKISAVRSPHRAPWVPTVNRNFPPVNRKFSPGSRNFPTANRKFPTTSRKFPTGSTKCSTADIGIKGKAPFDGGYVSFGQGGCKITGKGTIKTSKLEFENVYFVKDLKYNLFSVSQICDNKNSVLFTDSECIMLGRDFKLLDDILLRTPRQHNMYSIDLNNIVPHRDLTCLVAKASADECMLWHRRLGHLNFKTMNKLVRYNLVRGLPTKCFENDHTCTACLKGKQHKASCKSKLVNSVSKPLHTLHMDLFGPTSNRVLVNKSHNKTPYELFNGRSPAIGFLKPFGCHVMILNTLDNLGKFKEKGDEGYFIGYSMSNKAFRVFNKTTMRVEENLHVEFLENKAIEKGAGPNLLFDIDSLTKSINYVPVDAGTISTNLSGTKDASSQEVKKNVSSLRYIALPNWAHDALLEFFSSKPQDHCSTEVPEGNGNPNPTASTSNPPADQMETLIVETPIPTVSSPVPTAYSTDSQEPSSDARIISKRVANQVETPSLDNILSLTNRFEDILGVTINSDESNGVAADISNMEIAITASPTPTLKIHKDHPKSQIIGLMDTPIQTKNKSKEVEEQSFIATIHQKTDPTLFQFCLFSCFLSQVENKKISDALQDLSWVEAMQEELLQFKIQNVLVAQGHTQEEGIDYDEVFAPVARIEAIRLFLAYASFMGFKVYQMDVKSAFLYGTIDEEVYVMQPLGFQDPESPAKVYKVEKAMYRLHQTPRAWYGTLSKYLLKNGFQRGTIDQTLFIRRQRGDFILVQVYVDDIIFGSSNPQLCREFEALMHEKFQMSAMGELNFFLGLQVLQKEDGIFLLQDKYVGDILKKFKYSEVRSLNTPMDKENPWRKDGTRKDVDLHLYRSIIGSLMYLTASRPDIMALVPKESPFDLVAYSDSDYGGATQDRKSTTGGCQFLGRRLISWQCKKQTIVATSTTEAEYVAAASCCRQNL